MRTPAEHAYILRITINKTIVYLSCTVRLTTCECKHMQRLQKTIQREIQRLKRIDVYRCIFIWFIHMYFLRMEQMYRRMYMSMVRAWWCVCRLLGWGLRFDVYYRIYNPY